MSDNGKRDDAVMIGAGLGGLSAGLSLARRGLGGELLPNRLAGRVTDRVM